MTVPRHPNAVVIQPPTLTVSPLIRFGRYAALGLGILWGKHLEIFIFTVHHFRSLPSSSDS